MGMNGDHWHDSDKVFSQTNLWVREKKNSFSSTFSFLVIFLVNWSRKSDCPFFLIAKSHCQDIFHLFCWHQLRRSMVFGNFGLFYHIFSGFLVKTQFEMSFCAHYEQYGADALAWPGQGKNLKSFFFLSTLFSFFSAPKPPDPRNLAGIMLSVRESVLHLRPVKLPVQCLMWCLMLQDRD